MPTVSVPAAYSVGCEMLEFVRRAADEAYGDVEPKAAVAKLLGDDVQRAWVGQSSSPNASDYSGVTSDVGGKMPACYGAT